MAITDGQENTSMSYPQGPYAPPPPLPGPPVKRPWYSTLWAAFRSLPTWAQALIGVVAVVAIIGGIAGGADEETTSDTPVIPTTDQAADDRDVDPVADTAVTTVPLTTTTTAPPTTTTTAPPEDPEVTNARRTAASYVDMTGFSRSGLIDQLEFEGYSTEAATLAVDTLPGGVDWMAEAVESAQSYVGMMGFSHSGLVDQLEFEGFTPEQAEHGASVALG
jgi:hypothetical protein